MRVILFSLGSKKGFMPFVLRHKSLGVQAGKQNDWKQTNWGKGRLVPGKLLEQADRVPAGHA